MGDVYSAFVLVFSVCADMKSLRIISPWLQLLWAAAFMSLPSLRNKKKRYVCLYADGWHLTLASASKNRDAFLIPVKDTHRETETEGRHVGGKQKMWATWEKSSSTSDISRFSCWGVGGAQNLHSRQKMMLSSCSFNKDKEKKQKTNKKYLNI